MRNILFLLSFSVALKLSYLLFPVLFENNNENETLFTKYISIAKKNDSFWYQKIAVQGYSKIKNKRDLGYSQGKNFKQSEWAFFPLYPFSISVCSKFFNLSFDKSAFLLSIIFSVLSMVGIYWFGLLFFKNQAMALFSSMLLFCFPFSFYFSMFYTEAFFLAFIIFSFIAIYYERFLILSLVLVPLILVRPNGLIITLPLYLYFLEQKKILSKEKFYWRKLLEKKTLLNSLAFIVAPVTFIAFCIYQYKLTGYFFAFSIAQNGWYREFTFPFLSFFRKGDFSTQFNSFFTLVVLFYAIIVHKKLPISLNVFVFACLIFPLCSGSVMSMTRFVSVVFPLFFIFSESIYKFRYKYLFLLIIICFHYISFYGWMINHPISY